MSVSSEKNSDEENSTEGSFYEFEGTKFKISPENLSANIYQETSLPSNFFSNNI